MHSQKPSKRSVSGLVILDKPLGLTSNRALQKVKRLFNAKKAGHTGSLDPLATGLLPICLGEATKLSQYLLDADKTYEVTATLGSQTATGDAEGDVVETAPIPADFAEHLPAVLKTFEGEGTQIPSMYSAIKHQGKPLYEYARAGVEIERQPRAIHLYELVCLETTDTTFSLKVRCSKGTYVRTLVEDIAKALGTLGYVSKLVRTHVGPYQATDWVTLEQLEEALETGGFEALDRVILPLSSALTHWPAVELNRMASHYIHQGQTIRLPKLPPQGFVRLLSEHSQLLGVGEVMEDGTVAPRRLIRETTATV